MEQIKFNELNSFIGKPVHVGWANKACVWILLRIEGDQAILKTPKKKKILEVSVTDLYKTRQHESK